jgi:hypothetical protein
MSSSAHVYTWSKRNSGGVRAVYGESPAADGNHDLVVNVSLAAAF